MRIIRTLITGVDSHSQDPDDSYSDFGKHLAQILIFRIALAPNVTKIILTDDCGIAAGLNRFRPWLRTRMSCRVAQISLADERFSGKRVNKLFR